MGSTSKRVSTVLANTIAAQPLMGHQIASKKSYVLHTIHGCQAIVCSALKCACSGRRYIRYIPLGVLHIYLQHQCIIALRAMCSLLSHLRLQSLIFFAPLWRWSSCQGTFCMSAAQIVRRPPAEKVLATHRVTVCTSVARSAVAASGASTTRSGEARALYRHYRPGKHPWQVRDSAHTTGPAGGGASVWRIVAGAARVASVVRDCMQTQSCQVPSSEALPTQCGIGNGAFKLAVRLRGAGCMLLQ